MPVNGPYLWPQCNLAPPRPSVYTEKVGRPAKLRRRELDEPLPSENKLRGVKKFTKCKLCGGSGHNKRTCNRVEDVQHQEAVQQEPMTQQSANFGPTRREKLQVKKARQVGVNIEGSSCSISSINVNQSVNIHTPVFLKGGVSFTTVSRLRASTGVRDRVGQSSSTPTNPVVKSNSSQESFKKK